MADLPAETLPKKNQSVFETTGLELIGPFPVKNDDNYRADIVCSSSVLLLEQYILRFWLISQQTLQWTASGILIAAEENPTISCQIAASHLFVQKMLCNLASQNWRNQNCLQLSYN